MDRSTRWVDAEDAEAEDDEEEEEVGAVEEVLNAREMIVHSSPSPMENK